MNIKNYVYCKNCTQSIIKSWKGWPHRDIIPLLPRIIDGVCEMCSNNDGLDSSKIQWYNYHSEFNTGLPDYWLLEVRSQINKWGYPYYGEGDCPQCNKRSIISQMKYPNGVFELAHNCTECGVIQISRTS
jgi:hypothetical protein